MLHITSPHRAHGGHGQTDRRSGSRRVALNQPGLVTGPLPHTRTRRRLPSEQLLSSEVGGRGR